MSLQTSIKRVHRPLRRENEDSFTFTTPSAEYKFSCHYPNENPENYYDDIVKIMLYLGLFENLKT